MLFHYIGLVELNTVDIPAMSDLESRHSDIELGGSWSPSDCSAWQKVAIVIPYRDRFTHLLLLLDRLHTLLHRQKIHYQIFVVEQVISLFQEEFFIVIYAAVWETQSNIRYHIHMPPQLIIMMIIFI